MPLVPAQCWLRTFKLSIGPVGGTAFVISRHDRQWLITAKHVVDAAAAGGHHTINLTGHEGGHPLVNAGLDVVPVTEPGSDVAVFSLRDQKIAREDLPLTASADGVCMSQDVFFLGYPLNLQLSMSTLPMVKRGIISQRAIINGVNVWLVDGMNNPGFSGAPLVFTSAASYTNDWNVLGVVGSYVNQAIAVHGGAGVVPTNSGIIVVYDIKHATDAIDAFLGK
jgi:hypothetical protein